MLIEKHELIHELAELRDTINNLKLNNMHFAGLFDEYHEVDHEVDRIETGVKNTADAYLEKRKKKRPHLQDKLFQMIKNA